MLSVQMRRDLPEKIVKNLWPMAVMRERHNAEDSAQHGSILSLKSRRYWVSSRCYSLSYFSLILSQSFNLTPKVLGWDLNLLIILVNTRDSSN